MELANSSSNHNGARYISHIRSEDRALWDALDEIINIGSATGVPVQISHAKLAMKSLWGKSNQMIEKLDSARAQAWTLRLTSIPINTGNRQ